MKPEEAVTHDFTVELCSKHVVREPENHRRLLAGGVGYYQKSWLPSKLCKISTFFFLPSSGPAEKKLENRIIGDPLGIRTKYR
jgi:hypothetical protein